MTSGFLTKAKLGLRLALVVLIGQLLISSALAQTKAAAAPGSGGRAPSVG